MRIVGNANKYLRFHVILKLRLFVLLFSRVNSLFICYFVDWISLILLQSFKKSFIVDIEENN